MGDERAEPALEAPLILEYPYTRTTGPVVGRFLAGLRDGAILGARRRDGSVICPPTEYDPITADEISELVPLSPAGVVETWTWNGQPRPRQPFDQPFAWALIRLDGADTPLLHGVIVDGPEAMATGMRVRVEWRTERQGHISDIAGFVPEQSGLEDVAGGEPEPDESAVVKTVLTPIRLEYDYTPGRSLSAYLRAMKEKRILGDRCPDTGMVFVPPRGVSPVAGKPTDGFVELADTGYVESFNITRVPIPGRDDLEPPYCSAWIVLDGASVGFIGLVTGIEPESVRVGLRVKARWKPDDELEMSATSILSWEPTGEPDEVITDFTTVGRPPPEGPG